MTNMNDANGSKVIAFCNEFDYNILLADGFEEAFLGIGGAFNDEPVAVYDRDKCIDILARDFKRHAAFDDDNEETDFYEQAIEYFEYNVQGSYVGEKTPIFITPFS